MAVCTFAARLVIDVSLVLAAETVIDLSRQRDVTATHNTAFTTRVCKMAANKVEAILGDVGSYDDSDITVGDQDALELGLRLAILFYSNTFTLMQTPDNREALRELIDEIKELAAVRVDEVRPQFGEPDTSDVDNIYPGAGSWASEE